MYRVFLTSFLVLLFLDFAAQGQYPEGFAEEIVYDEFSYPAGILFGSETISYVFELNGLVWAIEENQVAENPMIDISEEVGFYGDHGLLSVALDPDFAENGYIYLLYNVDRHYLLHYGTENYDPEADDFHNGGMGRITRYQVDTDTYKSILPGSRHIVLGSEIGEGIPISSQFHGLGTIIFGEDGSLLVTTGDVNSAECCYTGTGPLLDGSDDSLNFEDGVLSEIEMVGAFRSQLPSGLSGKILRIDPQTGEGIANNPFFVEGDPNTALSKVWALGFRNPYRMVVRPGSGYGNLEEGHPGVIFLSDVGDWKWEEINVVREGGGNYGWPIYEGMEFHETGFAEAITYNQSAPISLSDSSSCNQEFYAFQDLLVQENQDHSYFFENPCSTGTSIPENILTFSHHRPAMAYRNMWGGEPDVLLPGFDDEGRAIGVSISESSEVNGEVFTGVSGAGGAFFQGEDIPLEYQDVFISADFVGWVRAFHVDENNEFSDIELWTDTIGQPVNIIRNPYDGCIYITTLFPSFVKRICFGGNLKPVVAITPDTVWGPSGTTVNFDASESFDPEGGPLEYFWDFGDGSTAEGAQVSHSYYSAGQEIESFTASVAVSDTGGAEGTAKALISLNNTPPQAEITSIYEGQLYSVLDPTVFQLSADVMDQEENDENLGFNWLYLLHHNTHFHRLDEFNFQNGEILVNPTGCSEGENYWYEINLKVTDSGGLTAFDRKMIYPDCDGQLMVGNTQEYTLYPNPVQQGLVIRGTHALDEQIDYRIYNTVGTLIQEARLKIYNGRSFFSVNVAPLQNGVYIIEFSNGGKSEKIRFLKF
ncbi:MAG TPA: PQQ-dependent sugar dehydrogenase [Cryomorphaceae bacterium]|nr:PQQ-dependent sugar dehydrogenase [Cryomorphaceae bacterium]